MFRILVTCFLTSVSFGASISVNSNCKVGTCDNTDLLAPGASALIPFDFTFTLPNSDNFHFVGTVGSVSTFDPASLSGDLAITAANVSVTFLGNNTTGLSGADTLVLDFLQFFQTPGIAGSNSSASEAISGDFSGAYAGASSVSGQGISTGGAAQVLMGPFFPPDPFFASNSNQPFSFAAISSLLFRDTIVFGEGSGVGATISVNNIPSATGVPEAGTSAYLALSLLTGFLLRRRVTA